MHGRFYDENYLNVLISCENATLRSFFSRIAGPLCAKSYFKLLNDLCHLLIDFNSHISGFMISYNLCPFHSFRSWDEFHDCANVAMAGCPEEAAAVWESLRQESKKMQFSGNLYDMCSNRNNHPAASASPHGSASQNDINQESLRGNAHHLFGCPLLRLLLSPLLLLLFWI